MNDFNLSFISVNEIFLFLIIIARIVGFFISTPGFSEPYVAPKIRVVIAIGLGLIVWLNRESTWLNQITNANVLFLLIESFLIGFLGGSVLRIAFSGLHTAGSLISYHMGLTNAFTNDPVFSSQSSIPANFLMTTAVFLIFITNSHHLIIGGFIQSFKSFPIFSDTTFLSLYKDFPDLAIKTITQAFNFALMIASPMIIVGLLVQASMGIINRLIPQIQVFFIMQPLQMVLGILIFMLIIPIVLTRFMENLHDLITYLLY